MLPHLDHELVVALVGAVFPCSLRLDHHAHAIARLEGGDRLDRGAEIGNVEPPAQAFGQRGLEEFDHQVLALLADVHANLVVRQGHDDAARAVGAAAEIQIPERLGFDVCGFPQTRVALTVAGPAVAAGSSTTSSDFPCSWAL